MAIYRGSGGTGTGSESDFAELVQQAQDAAAAAQLAETNAELAEVNAELAETNAEIAATNAAASETNSANSASSASTSATNAAASATSASNSASTATTQASNAASSATSAATSVSSASTSATNAANSATAAQTAQTAAELAETNAETAEVNAAASATSAANSATSASTSATNASNSASAASTSATNAANSASAAATSETNAANSATSAANSASTATTQASNAASSASAAATSASNAATSETNAANSASSASTSATNAANSASAALTSETNAASSASAASTSASNAATSATNAAASASAAAASYDDFDDRYLGPKSVAPTLDNDGNALQVGALYFNTVSNYMKVWNGTAWLDAYASLSGALLAANNLSDVSNTATSRTNLGAAASGANTDILSMSGITGGISTADYLDLDTAATPAAVVGRLSWDDGNGTANITLKGGNVNLQVGQELVARVYNDSGSSLTDGQIVYISGAQGNRIAVKLANASSEATSAGTLGMVTEPIASGAEGFITIMGTVNGLNTTGLTAGALVYLSASTAGAYTTTAPTAPNHRVILGYVERVHATVGSIYVKVDNGYELDELHNVNITSPANNQALIYNSSTNVWNNSSIKTVNGNSLIGSGDITITSGITAVFPFKKEDGTSDPINLLSQAYLPFYDNTGSSKNIQLTT